MTIRLPIIETHVCSCERLSIEAAIVHAREVAASSETDCPYQHLQLASWLEEFVACKERNAELAERLEWARQDLIRQADEMDDMAAQIAAQAGGRELAGYGIKNKATGKFGSWLYSQKEWAEDAVLKSKPPYQEFSSNEYLGPIPLYENSTSAPANALAIAQAALEAAAKVCEIDHPHTFARSVGSSIRAIPPQSILDSMEE
ncbi:hypothetical protein [Herminiimonas sp. CN]|uniref:hypothetical protein n=1 Tax=Herminiimonas sp. CN TaxID=1349818 RepID=UPI0005558F34|nr:hypothetical protein [Herminiimonas sp. CN]